MSREWKPGDVALVTAYANPKIALVRPRREAIDLLEFAYVEGGYDIAGDADVPARPLVVIDPEDRDRAGRLSRLFLDEYSKYDRRLIVGGSADAMQAALGRVLVPPKPEEPQGLGAVVEDADGAIWTRVATHAAAPWYSAGVTGAATNSRSASWSRIDVARKLSDGWTPDAAGGAS